MHFELIGPDPTRPGEFYSELFGWNPPVGVLVSAAVSEETEYSFISPEAGRALPLPGSVALKDSPLTPSSMSA